MNQKMRGTLSVLVSASMVAGVGLGTAYGAFEDTQGHWGQAAIDRWNSHGIANGYENGTFRPDGSMTRAEVATLLADLLNLEKRADISGYSDVPADAWYTDAIAKCVAAGILNGFEDGTMAPDAEIPRQQVFVMFARAIGLEPVKGAVRAFTDSGEIAPWAEGYINALVRCGVLNGVGGGRLAPLSVISRASAMTILDNAIGTYVDEAGSQVEISGEDGRMVLVVAQDVTVTGEVDRLIVSGTGNSVTVDGAQVSEVALLAGENQLVVSGGSQVGDIVVHETASDAAVTIEKGAAVDTVTSSASGVMVSGAGSLENAVITGDNNAINTNGTKVEVSDDAAGTTVNGKPVEGGSTVDPSEPENGGGSGGGDSDDDTDTDQSVDSVLLTDVDEKTFQVGVPEEFTFTTVANDDAGVKVKGTFQFSNMGAVAKLEYYEVQSGQWHTFTGDFGPEGGFPMADATSRFRVTFRTPGTYDLTVSMKSVKDGQILCSYSTQLEVSQLAENVAAVNSAESFAAAVSQGKNIILTGDFSAEQELKVDQAITIDGNGFTITSRNSATGGQGAGILVTAPATLQDITVVGPNNNPSAWDSGQYGIKLYKVDGVVLENVTVRDANAGIQLNSSSAAMRGEINVSGNEFGGIEVAKGSGLDKPGALDLTAATLRHDTESITNPVIWIDGNEEGGSVTGGETLFTITLEGSKTLYYLNNYVAEAIRAADSYVYEDGYTYRGVYTVEEKGKTLSIRAEYTAEAAAEDSGKAVLNDMARFLGALHRQDEGKTIRKIVFDGNTYTWDTHGVLLGSNWKHDGTTLVSAITEKALSGQKSFSLTIEDITLELSYSVTAQA